ncbi:sporulation protein [Thermoflavimicrobium daqui]|jgi:sporulation-control protein|uniref:Sporulation protein SpoOM n=1 Tax=Thermoflavimicrobium daqui TaxID=2137476 RepID=A0A364K6D5_9BACL|nr:sporulation protein [Thermoflavimicrobium daqui]RAL25869.1 sporulation protein SpoOM [Thermoflavimicrobium daqui]
MFKKFLANLGHGGAKVNLVLNRDQFKLGELVDGEIHIYGGNVEQQINHIEVSLTVESYHDEHFYTHIIQKIPFSSSFVIESHEHKVLPFQLTLPKHGLISGNFVSYYFKTHLDIMGAVDHKDKDYIYIHPSFELQNILNALEQLGFREKHDSRKPKKYGQEFELYPTHVYRNQIEEIEFIPILHEDGIQLMFEVDLYSFGHERELKRDLFIANSLLQNVNELISYFQQVLNEMIGHNSKLGHGISSTISYGHHYPNHHPSHHKGLGAAAGAIGGFAAGMLGGMALEKMLDDDENDNDFFAGDSDDSFDDFFDGDNE